MYCTLILVTQEFSMLLFKGPITFFDINTITRAKRRHQAVEKYYYSDTIIVMMSCTYKLSICSFNTNRLKYVLFLCSIQALPLIFRLNGCQNRNQHVRNPIERVNHTGSSCNLAKMLTSLGG